MRSLISVLVSLLVALQLVGYRLFDGSGPATEPTTEIVTEPATEPITEPTVPAHSQLFIPGLDVDTAIRYFNEVCLDAEFVNGGDATLLQKWQYEITYTLLGTPTPEDKAVVEEMAAYLNRIPGFPGMQEALDPNGANMRIHFVSESELLEIMGENFTGCDGGVTFWYDSNNSIYDGVICIRTDLEQYVRNSVIQEEIYNGLGPVQDTDLRPDSMIYSGYSTPQDLTDVDRLILSLLYHPDIRCGMTAAECEAVIRQLYY